MGIRILRGPLQTADLRGPCIFHLFLEIRILRGPSMRGPQQNNQASRLFFEMVEAPWWIKLIVCNCLNYMQITSFLSLEVTHTQVIQSSEISMISKIQKLTRLYKHISQNSQKILHNLCKVHILKPYITYVMYLGSQDF